MNKSNTEKFAFNNLALTWNKRQKSNSFSPASLPPESLLSGLTEDGIKCVAYVSFYPTFSECLDVTLSCYINF